MKKERMKHEEKSKEQEEEIDRRRDR